MRLLNAATLEVEEFFDGHAPKYGILSHRWLDGEVTLQEMQAGTAFKKAGYQKVADVCKQALVDGLNYAWVDTCCIDKTSSAELSEAINSMYRWYQEAEICYALLSDVSADDVSCGDGDDEFSSSVWFTRGWTLQELIAPERVDFYNASWRMIGTKDTLGNAIAEVTQIHPRMLKTGGRLEDYSLAQRMSWASRRVTTRKEDSAYCLLGIFGVNMPMLYGEGDRAFNRLQEEIMKISDDQSLFAWSSDAEDNVARGMLAQSPSNFAGCSNVHIPDAHWNKLPYTLSNMGLSIQLAMAPWTMDTYVAMLDCQRNGNRLGIFLRMLPQDNQYARVRIGDGDIIEDPQLIGAYYYKYRNVYVRQRQWGAVPPPERFYGFWIRTLPPPSPDAIGSEQVMEVLTREKWDSKNRVFEIATGSGGTAGVLYVSVSWGMTVIKIGFDSSFNPRLQLGGGMFGPEMKNLDRFSEEGKLHPSWMDESGSMYLHKGERLSGLDVDEHPGRIRMFNAIIPGTEKMGYVVDIQDWQSAEERGRDAHRICDFCNQQIYGTYHRCTVCSDFDYCSTCITTANRTHGSHEFEAIT